jgi:hypothetical protein
MCLGRTVTPDRMWLDKQWDSKEREEKTMKNDNDSIGGEGRRQGKREETMKDTKEKRQPYYLKPLELTLNFRYGQSILQDPTGLSYKRRFW